NLLLLEQQGQSTPLKVAGELADESAQPIRLLVVATKAWAVADALDSVLHRLTPDSQILLLQNGLGSQQAVSRRLPDHRVLYASVTDGAWLRSPNQVVWAGSGQTLIGDPAAGPAPDWLQRLTRAGIDWRWESDILPVLWLKLAVNCAINPLSALHDCPNGEVPERAGAIFEPLLAALQALLSSEGVSLSLAELRERILAVIRATASNISSIRQDVLAGRRTEIDFILGHAWLSARQAGMSTPVLGMHYLHLHNHLTDRSLPRHSSDPRCALSRRRTSEETFMGYRLSKLNTRTGDAGTTGLADGSRVPKDSPRIEAMGTVDELNSSLGVLLA